MNYKTNAIKWLAIITMTIDHIGFFLFPGVVWFRLVGRIAFPCFLYTTIKGVERTRDFRKYIIRFLITGLIAMWVTTLIGTYINILFTLSLFAISLKYPSLFIPTFLLSYFTEYGFYGFLLGWAINITINKDWRIGALFLILLHIGSIDSIQTYALLAMIPIILPMEIKLPRVPKWLAYSYYPLHQLILIWISFLK